jgi:hypothetical protein
MKPHCNQIVLCWLMNSLAIIVGGWPRPFSKPTGLVPLASLLLVLHLQQLLRMNDIFVVVIVIAVVVAAVLVVVLV